MKQLFQIGEEVILESPTYPKYNGDYFIVGVINGIEMLERYGVIAGVVATDIFYELDGLAIELHKIVSKELTGVICGHANQNSLRKKHKPSGESFQTMMTKLNRIPV